MVNPNSRCASYSATFVPHPIPSNTIIRGRCSTPVEEKHGYLFTALARFVLIISNHGIKVIINLHGNIAFRKFKIHLLQLLATNEWGSMIQHISGIVICFLGVYVSCYYIHHQKYHLNTVDNTSSAHLFLVMREHY